MNTCLYATRVTHHRKVPKEHRFVYRITYWLFDLDELDSVSRSVRFFSRNRFNWLAFYDRDHGDGSERDLKQQVSEQLMTAGLPEAHTVKLLCLPRMLGYVFNPLSIYYCYRNNRLYALLYEVRNTFGEKHTYIIPCKNEQEAGAVIQQQAAKKMHVSPFMAMDYQYQFSMTPPDHHLKAVIAMINEQGSVFHAALSGQRHAITSGNIARQCLMRPLTTVKVMAAILWQAGLLMLKKLPVYRHKPREKKADSSSGIEGFREAVITRGKNGLN